MQRFIQPTIHKAPRCCTASHWVSCFSQVSHIFHNVSLFNFIMLLMRCFFFSGFLTFSNCVLHHFFYFSSLKTWGEAQIYCRQKYTDLATFTNTDQISLLSMAGSSNAAVSDVWIGLICGFNEVWSDLVVGSALNWENQARNDSLFAYHFCGSISKNGIEYEHWSVQHAFICQNGEHAATHLRLVYRSM